MNSDVKATIDLMKQLRDGLQKEAFIPFPQDMQQPGQPPQGAPPQGGGQPMPPGADPSQGQAAGPGGAPPQGAMPPGTNAGPGGAPPGPDPSQGAGGPPGGAPPAGADPSGGGDQMSQFAEQVETVLQEISKGMETLSQHFTQELAKRDKDMQKMAQEISKLTHQATITARDHADLMKLIQDPAPVDGSVQQQM